MKDEINKVFKQVFKKFLKEEKKEMGGYEDCGQFYCDEVMRTEVKIEVLVSQKISFEKWRKKLSYEQSDLQD